MHRRWGGGGERAPTEATDDTRPARDMERRPLIKRRMDTGGVDICMYTCHVAISHFSRTAPPAAVCVLCSAPLFYDTAMCVRVYLESHPPLIRWISTRGVGALRAGVWRDRRTGVYYIDHQETSGRVYILQALSLVALCWAAARRVSRLSLSAVGDIEGAF